MSDRAAADDHTLLVDASVLITLADVGSLDLLAPIQGTPVVPWAVAAEVRDEPARRALATAVGDGWIRIERADRSAGTRLADAGTHLGAGDPTDGFAGDVALLAIALASEEVVVVSDDKPLRQTCKALSVPVSGSIGVLVRSVEVGEIDPERAKAKLLAMDEVGARLSASLLRRAERLIVDAARR